MIEDNLKSVTQRMAKSCAKSGRSCADVKLVCVTKEALVEEINDVIDLGIVDIGENRVQDALYKYKSIGRRCLWHLIGHLQTNKVKDAVSIFSLIHSVDSIHLVEEIDKCSKRINKVQDILVQVNVSGESSKFGLKPEELNGFFKKSLLYPNINILGLMTIAPESRDPEESRPYFRKLRELRDEINNSQLTAHSSQLLSMGMSNDFEVAIEEGSTMVRIGRAIFSG